MNNNNVLPLFVFVLFFLVINLLGVSYLCFKEYNRQDVRTEVIGVQNQIVQKWVCFNICKNYKNM